MNSTPASLRADARRLRRCRLPALDTRIEMLETAVHVLRDIVDRNAENLAPALDLSPAMIRWCMNTTTESITAERLEALHRMGPGGPPVGLNAMVLSGNVFTAALRPVVVSLLFGVPVIAKGSTRDSAIAKLLSDCLPAPLQGAFALHTYPGNAPAELHQALFEEADLVQVFGSDTTLESLRPHCPDQAEWLPHGHGLGFIWLDGPLGSEEARAVADDIAAYDQRGCLSPVELLHTGLEASLLPSISRLHHALRTLATTRPRGPLPETTKAQLGSWRAAAQALGQTWEGPDHILALGEMPSPPPGRHLLLRHMPRKDALERCQRLGPHLKRLATSPHLELPKSLAQKRCDFGQMQRPPLEHWHDGHAPWQGLIR